MFCLCSLFSAFNRTKPVFTLKRGIFFSVSLCFSLAFVCLPLFHGLVLCLSLVRFFLPSFFFLPFSHFDLWFLFFVFVWFVFSRCVFFFLLVLLFCFESHVCWLCILFSCCCCFFLLWYVYFWLPITKHLSHFWKFSKMRSAEKKNVILTRAVSTSVLTKSIFFKFCMFC